MKIVILTSDILDGIIITQYILRSGKDVKAIIYERRPRAPRSLLKRLLYRAKGVIEHLSYEGMAVEGVVVRGVDNINSDETGFLLDKISPELMVVIGTRKLKKEIYGKASIGAINMHSGILPYYRGADSEFWALYNGEKDRIGVSIHFINEELDGGDIVLQARQKVAKRDDYRSLRMKNILLGAGKMVETIDLIESGKSKRIRQDERLARTYKSATREDIRSFRKKRSRVSGKISRVMKEFGRGELKTREMVAREPSLREHAPRGWEPDIFCLRIDADEYAEGPFSAYYPLFEKYRDALTVFFNARSFGGAEKELLKCREIGIDMQSHAFYHYTYGDYASNRHNIKKAKEFFDSLGIGTIGFAAPYGRWNEHFARALEDEGYSYSSEFSYDYMAFPSYPRLGGRVSSVLEIPVFPVAPELFCGREGCDTEEVFEYYAEAIDTLVRCGIPAIVYAHTHPMMPAIPSLLERICEYALGEKGLKAVSMTGFYNMWTEMERRPGEEAKAMSARPGDGFLGKVVPWRSPDAIKRAVRDAIDFERVTPEDDLKCGRARRALKLAARKIGRKK